MDNSLYRHFRDDLYHQQHNHCCGLIPPKTFHWLTLSAFLSLFLATAFSLAVYDYTLALPLKYYQLYLILFTLAIIFVLILSQMRQRYGDGNVLALPTGLIIIVNIFITILGIYSLLKTSYKLFKVPYIITCIDVTVFSIITLYMIHKHYFTLTPGSLHGFSSNGASNSGSDHNRRRYTLASNADIDDDTDIELELDMYLPSGPGLKSGASNSANKHQLMGNINVNSGYNTRSVPQPTRHQVNNDSLDDLDIMDEFTDVE